MATEARREILNGEIARMFDVSGSQFAAGIVGGVIVARALIDRDRETFDGIAEHFAEISRLVGGDSRTVQEFASRLIRAWDIAG